MVALIISLECKLFSFLLIQVCLHDEALYLILFCKLVFGLIYNTGSTFGKKTLYKFLKIAPLDGWYLKKFTEDEILYLPEKERQLYVLSLFDENGVLRYNDISGEYGNDDEKYGIIMVILARFEMKGYSKRGTSKDGDTSVLTPKGERLIESLKMNKAIEKPKKATVVKMPHIPFIKPEVNLFKHLLFPTIVIVAGGVILLAITPYIKCNTTLNTQSTQERNDTILEHKPIASDTPKTHQAIFDSMPNGSGKKAPISPPKKTDLIQPIQSDSLLDSIKK